MESELQIKSKRTRSPGYPAIDLAEAMAKTKAIYSQQRQYPSNRETLARILGYSGLTGTSTRVIAALSDFGLLEGYGDTLRISDVGQDLALHVPGDPEYAIALRIALASPSFFRDLDELYPHGLPSEHSLRAALIKRGFTERAIEAAISVYSSSKALESHLHVDTTESEKPNQIGLEDDRVENVQGGSARNNHKRSVTIPVSNSKWAELVADFPLTKREWDQMIAILQAMEPSLVHVVLESTSPVE